MRIWDIEPRLLCRQHLLGEHRELHAIWNIITKNKRGYSKHPEVLRWRGKLSALDYRHDELVREMLVRGYKHNSSLCFVKPTELDVSYIQDEFVNSREEQISILRAKKCECAV